MTSQSKIAIFGQYKSGTTALFYKIKNSLPPNTRTLFEPTEYISEKEDSVQFVLAKVILGVQENSHAVKYESFIDFEKKIYITRDPRDWVVSGMLFLIQQLPTLDGNNDKLTHIMELLKNKERVSESIPVTAILRQVLNAIPDRSFEKVVEWIPRQHKWLFEFEEQLGEHVTIKYEDLVEARTADLENFLEIPLHGEARVDGVHDNVTRTKSAGDWRNWFLPEDIEFFKPLFSEYIKHYGYSDQWDLNDEQVIKPEHCTGYVERTVTKRRSPLREQYELEKELALRLRIASGEKRSNLYSWVYDEFIRRMPHERLIALKQSPEAQRHRVGLQSQLLKPFLSEDTIFLEVGAGDCALTLHLAEQLRQVFVVELSEKVVGEIEAPGNFRLIVSDTPPYDLTEGSIDLAFSCHFIEHLHPDDASDHANEMHRVLRLGGHYVCVTPNRLLGPHDVSKYFDSDQATGLHLKEYTHTELKTLLRKAGFSKIKILKGIGKPPSWRPMLPYLLVELFLESLPTRLRRRLLKLISWRHTSPFRPLEQVVLVGVR